MQKVGQPLPNAAQARMIGAALELFAQQGVGGTSSQMIADAIGVTEAVVYHQFNAKDDIIPAAAEAELVGGSGNLTRRVPPNVAKVIEAPS